MDAFDGSYPSCTATVLRTIVDFERDEVESRAIKLSPKSQSTRTAPISIEDAASPPSQLRSLRKRELALANDSAVIVIAEESTACANVILPINILKIKNRIMILHVVDRCT